MIKVGVPQSGAAGELWTLGQELKEDKVPLEHALTPIDAQAAENVRGKLEMPTEEGKSHHQLLVALWKALHPRRVIATLRGDPVEKNRKLHANTLKHTALLLDELGRTDSPHTAIHILWKLGEAERIFKGTDLGDRVTQLLKLDELKEIWAARAAESAAHTVGALDLAPIFYGKKESYPESLATQIARIPHHPREQLGSKTEFVQPIKPEQAEQRAAEIARARERATNLAIEIRDWTMHPIGDDRRPDPDVAGRIRAACAELKQVAVQLQAQKLGDLAENVGNIATKLERFAILYPGRALPQDFAHLRFWEATREPLAKALNAEGLAESVARARLKREDAYQPVVAAVVEALSRIDHLTMTDEINGATVGVSLPIDRELLRAHVVKIEFQDSKGETRREHPVHTTTADGWLDEVLDRIMRNATHEFHPVYTYSGLAKPEDRAASAHPVFLFERR
jgi:hypothetical protein